MKIFLVTRPNYDIVTRYLYAWNGTCIDEAIKRGHEVLDLKKEKANRKQLESRIAKMNPSFIMINGHGGYNCVTGHDEEVLIMAGKNEKLLENKVVYALSCKSASGLGIASVKAGASCYVGYMEDFIFYHEYNKITRPLEDKVAKLFLDPSNLLTISVIKGNSASVASKKSRKAFQKNILKLLNSETEDGTHYISALYWDMKHQVCLGEGRELRIKIVGSLAAKKTVFV